VLTTQKIKFNMCAGWWMAFPRFVFSQNPQAELFNCAVQFVRGYQGDYVLVNNRAIANIYIWISELSTDGIPQEWLWTGVVPPLLKF
jgi:hypothetical protein